MLLAGAVGYFFCAAIGTLLSVPPSGFAIVWPATAFLISMFLISQPRRWLSCIAGVVPTHFLIAAVFQPHAPFIVVLTQVGGNLLLALVTVAAVRHFLGKRPRFNTLNSILAFIGIAAIAAPAVVNSITLSLHLAIGWISDFWLAWWQWMIAGIFPTATIPLLVSLAAIGKLTGYTGELAKPERELAALAGLLFACTFLAYDGNVDAARWPVLFLVPFPFLLWAAVRLGVGGTCLSLLVFATATIVQALWHHGPFAVDAPIDQVTSLQTYLVTTSIPLILLAALMDERRQAEFLLQLSEARMQTVASETDTFLWQWEPTKRILWMTDHCRQMFGLTDVAGLTPDSLLDALLPTDRGRMWKAIECALVPGKEMASEEYRLNCDGNVRWITLAMHSDFDRTGNLSRLSGVFRDVTERKCAQIETERLRKKLLRLRQDERRRIAEELHDSTAQHLVAANLSLTLLKTKFRVAGSRNILTDAMQSIREAAREIRTFSYLLHPPQLGTTGLSAVLQDYLPGFESRTGVHTSLRLNSQIDRLPIGHQHAILRIAQESLGNVHRHAGASNVWISVRFIADSVHLLVRDDGKGIEVEASEKLSDRLRLGVGIPAMAARVKRLRGRLEVSSRAKGTTVHVAFPLPKRLASTLH
jgi:PAS domain S-box-containing protein